MKSIVRADALEFGLQRQSRLVRGVSFLKRRGGEMKFASLLLAASCLLSAVSAQRSETTTYLPGSSPQVAPGLVVMKSGVRPRL